MADGFDFSELSKFERDLLDTAQKFKNGKPAKKFLRKEGKELRKLTLKKAKSRVKKKTGNLYKGIKKGKVYSFREKGNLAIRVYGGSPAHHIHLLEYGHRQVTKDGKEIGFVKGKFFFEDTANEYTDTFYHETQKFIDEVLDEGI